MKQELISTASLCALEVPTAPGSTFTENEHNFLTAAKNNEVSAVKVFLEQYNPAEKLAEGSTVRHLCEAALVFAARYGHYETVKLLLSQGFTISAPHSRTCFCDDCSTLGMLMKSLSRLNLYRALASPIYLSLSYLVLIQSPEDFIDEKRHVTKQKLQQGFGITEDDEFFSRDENTASPREGFDDIEHVNLDKLEKPRRTEFVDKDAKVLSKYCVDSIHRALELKGRLEKLAESEYEFKSEYKGLSKQCEEYVVGLLEMCHNMDEIACVMNEPDTTESNQHLSVLYFAISNKSSKFVGHPYSQLMLNSLIYAGFPSWQYKPTAVQCMLAALYIVLIPFGSLFYLVAPSNSVSRMLTTPLAKFLSHTGSFCWFIVLVGLSSIEDAFGIGIFQVSVINILVLLWVLGLALEEFKEIIRQGHRRYFSQWWNTITLAMLVLFIIAGLLWMMGYGVLSTERDMLMRMPLKKALYYMTRETAFQITLLSTTFYSAAILLAFLHITNILQLSPSIGPLYLSLIQMIRDVAKFFFLFVVLFIAFVLAIRKVYSKYELMAHVYSNITGPAEHTFARISGGGESLFWALFEQTSLDQFTVGRTEFLITEMTGKCLFALFLIITVLVALNMLIAMMSDSFMAVAGDADVHWKFSRTQMWLQYVDKGSVVPSPFNLIPSWKNCLYIVEWVRHRVTQCQSSFYEEIENLEDERGKINQLEKRRLVIRDLITRYLEEEGVKTVKTSQSITIDRKFPINRP